MPFASWSANPASVTTTIALIGDLHGSWDDQDVRAFNASDYDLLIFTGDLGSGTARNGVAIAQSMSRLSKPAIVMPGNNDAPFLSEIAAEFGFQRGLAAILELDGRERSNAHISLSGYRLHRIACAGQTVSIVTGRPCAMGGGELSFPVELERNYEISSMQASTDRLLALINEVDTQKLLILGHNGPYGLGTRAGDIWGCDFRAEEGDWGDPDLAAAVQRARTRGLDVFVVAGHMHQGLRTGGHRRWEHRQDGVMYVNPARVPRIYADDTTELRYHVALDIHEDGFFAREVTWSDE